MKYNVTDPVFLDTISYDKILVTTINSRHEILEKIAQRGIPSDQVIEIN